MSEEMEINWNWYGNDGLARPVPGTVETMICGICGVQMDVRRNECGATCLGEGLTGRKHKYDEFKCPHLNKDWHKKIYKLKWETLLVIFGKQKDANDIKQKVEKEIIEILKDHQNE